MSEIKRQSKRAKIFRTIFFLLTAFFSVFLSCGIDEYYYLPQVPENNIERTFNTGAIVILPSISSYYGAQYYNIYYRIYISDKSVDGVITNLPSQEIRDISSVLFNDINAFSSVTDPTSTSLPSANTFSNCEYFDLEFVGEDINSMLSASGGRLNIVFPTEVGGIPYVILNNGSPVYLRRCSEKLTSPSPNDLYFQNTSELSNFELSSSNTIINYGNKDVSSERSELIEHAYVSMYVVAVGYNNREFTRFFSKPTHISIFKLPNTNL